MRRILFLIHDLGSGGAEKVLVNLVNHLDLSKFDVSVISLFGGGVNEKRLSKDVKYRAVFPREIRGNSHIMKLFTPEQLHALIVKEHYDIEIAYLEGPSSRIISGCKDKNTCLVNWVHGELGTRRAGSVGFRSEKEAEKCYNRFDRTICVSETVKKDFTSIFQINHPCEVLYNTVDSNDIIDKSREAVEEIVDEDAVRLVSVGTLKNVKGYDRLLRIVKRLRDEGKRVHLYLLGDGPLRKEFEQYVKENKLENAISFLGFQANPYKYVAKCDLFVCSSHREGFSTAATEALIVGTPVCTVEVSGMKEMLGENNEYGLVTKNSEEALYHGIRRLLDDPALLAHYQKQAAERGKHFSTKNTVSATEERLASYLTGAAF